MFPLAFWERSWQWKQLSGVWIPASNHRVTWWWSDLVAEHQEAPNHSILDRCGKDRNMSGPSRAI